MKHTTVCLSVCLSVYTPNNSKRFSRWRKGGKAIFLVDTVTMAFIIRFPWKPEGSLVTVHSLHVRLSKRLSVCLSVYRSVYLLFVRLRVCVMLTNLYAMTTTIKCHLFCHLFFFSLSLSFVHIWRTVWIVEKCENQLFSITQQQWVQTTITTNMYPRVVQ